MTTLSDQEFESALKTLEQGRPPRPDLPAEDAADLTTAARLMAQQVTPSSRLRQTLIEATALSSSHPEGGRHATRPILTGYRRVAWVVATFGALALLVFSASPTARASVMSFIKEIGGIFYNETGTFPLPAFYTPEPGNKETAVSLAEAEAELGMTIPLPTWLPEGFTQDPKVIMFHFSEGSSSANVTWRRTVKPGWTTGWEETLWLAIDRASQTRIVGPDSVETVWIHGQPAGLTHGFWNGETRKWDDQNGLTLTWKRGEAIYRLFSSSLTSEELIRVAESVP